MNSDVQIAGDPLAIPHLLPPVPDHPTTVAAFAGLARRIADDRAGWAPLVRYDATSRWYHRLRTGPGYEVWLLSWVPGQSTGAHDHGASSGLLTVLQGRLTERCGTGPRTTRHTLTVGTQRVFAPGYVHDIANDALEPAVSLHIYHPGLTDMPMHPSQERIAALARPAAAAGGVVPSSGGVVSSGGLVSGGSVAPGGAASPGGAVSGR